LTAEILATTTRNVALDPDIQTRAKAMQSLTRMAGGFKRAAEAIIDFASNTSDAAPRFATISEPSTSAAH
jgi:hypothetical protein